MKEKIFIISGLLGSGIASLFGGWDLALQTLLLCMLVDWFTGGILLPVRLPLLQKESWRRKIFIKEQLMRSSEVCLNRQ